MYLSLYSHKYSTSLQSQDNRFSNPSVSLTPILDIKTRGDSSGPNSDFQPSNEHRKGKYEYANRSTVHANSAVVSGFNVVKAEPVDETMDGKGTLLIAKDRAPNHPALHSENGHSDSVPTVTSRDNLATGSDSRPSDGSAGLPDDATDRDMDSRVWSLQDGHRQYSYDRWQDHPRRTFSVSEQRPIEETVIQMGPDEPVPVDERRSADIVRPSASETSFRISDDIPPVDPRPLVDYRMNADARLPLPSRPEGDNSSTFKPSAFVSRASVPPVGTPGFATSESSAQDRMNTLSRQSTHDAVTVSGEHGPRSNSRPSPHFFPKKKFNKNQIGASHGSGTNNGGLHGSPSDPPPRSAYARPPSPSFGPPHPSPVRSFRHRSPSVDGHRGRQPLSATGTRAHYRRPSSRDISHDRPVGYRADYGGSDAPIRHGDGRPYGRDYSPPPGDRGLPPPDVYPPPPSGGGPGRDWGYGPYPHGRRDWTAAEEDVYLKSRAWEGRPPINERERYEREYLPSRSTGWAERDYPRGWL